MSLYRIITLFASLLSHDSNPAHCIYVIRRILRGLLTTVSVIKDTHVYLAISPIPRCYCPHVLVPSLACGHEHFQCLWNVQLVKLTGLQRLRGHAGKSFHCHMYSYLSWTHIVTCHVCCSSKFPHFMLFNSNASTVAIYSHLLFIVCTWTISFEDIVPVHPYFWLMHAMKYSYFHKSRHKHTYIY